MTATAANIFDTEPMGNIVFPVAGTEAATSAMP